MKKGFKGLSEWSVGNMKRKKGRDEGGVRAKVQLKWGECEGWSGRKKQMNRVGGRRGRKVTVGRNGKENFFPPLLLL
jgi:hypothetical protein